MNTSDNKLKNDPGGKGSSPRKSTVDFLKQFARVYHVEPTLKQDISAYLLN